MLRIKLLLIAAIPAMAAWAVSPATVKLQLFFVANAGQAPSEVRFMAQASGLTAYFLPGEVRFTVADEAVRLRFEGTGAPRDPAGRAPLAGRANLLSGTPDHWRRDVAMFGEVVYRNLYPGIDVVYGGHGQELKSEFMVAAGADPSRIRLRYSGSGRVRIDALGRLVIPAGVRELHEEPPTVYQESRGVRTAVDGRYSLAPDRAVSFQLGKYDRQRPLVIDPTLSYSTLLGGSGSNAVTAVAVDASGAAYLAGITASYDFPVAGALQRSSAGGNEAFVAKLNSSGNGLVYCTYLGGSGDDRAFGVAVDAAGDVFVTGSTTSADFPVLSPLQAKLAGGRNGFVAKLNPAGNVLLYSTYLGGNGFDIANSIALDSSGNAYIVGDTTSSNFPASGIQSTNRGAQDAFVAKVSADGSQLLYGTYLGGSSVDHGAAIAVDASGSAYVTGSTFSADFPTANPWQASNAGGQDVFISRLSADGSTLLYSTYLGGSGGTVSYPETGMAIALDQTGNAYVTGVTSSTNFPVLNALQPGLLGGTDVFLVKLSPSGTPAYATYLGGTGQEVGTAIAVDHGGNAYFAGYGYSIDLPVTTDALQKTNAGDYDAFVGKLNASGTSLLYLSYLGGSGSDAAAALALDSTNNLYVGGWTLSTNFPVLNAYQSASSANYSGFVTKFSFPALPQDVAVTPNSGSGSSQVFSLQFSDPTGASDLTTVSALVNATSSTVSGCAVTYSPTQNTLMLLTDTGAAPATAITPGSGSQQNSQCVLSGSGSSAVLQGTVLTLNLALTFQSGFSGTKNLYMQAANPAGSTGWQPMGTWTIAQPPAPPAVISVTPSSGSGVNQTFSYLIADPKGAGDLTQVWMEISTGLNATANSCYARYDAAPNALYLYNDAATAWLGPITPGSSVTLQNSQCTLSAAGSTVSASGNNLTVNVSLSFQPSFAGAKTIYVSANSASANTGWQTEGAWTVPGSVNSIHGITVTPASGSGAAALFSYVVSDQAGASDVTQVWMEISTNATAASNSCYARYDAAPNALYLLNDAGTTWTGPATPGGTAVLQNSQCTLTAGASTVSKSGNNLTLTISLSFKPAFVGLRTVYVSANNSTMGTGWQCVGTWTVTNPANTISFVSVTPRSGSGSSQNFAYLVSDQKGAADLTQLWMNISTGLGVTASSCYTRFDAGPNVLYLMNDAGTAWLGPLGIGMTAILQNSQCVLNAASSSVTSSGNNVTVSLSLRFKTPAFTGAKNLYVYGNSAAAYTGWLLAGTWTVN